MCKHRKQQVNFRLNVTWWLDSEGSLPVLIQYKITPSVIIAYLLWPYGFTKMKPQAQPHFSKQNRCSFKLDSALSLLHHMHLVSLLPCNTGWRIGPSEKKDTRADAHMLMHLTHFNISPQMSSAFENQSLTMQVHKAWQMTSGNLVSAGTGGSAARNGGGIRSNKPSVCAVWADSSTI